MNSTKRERAAVERSARLELYAKLLDPHLAQTERQNEVAKRRWSLRKSMAFIIAASVLLWALIILGISFLLKIL